MVPDSGSIGEQIPSVSFMQQVNRRVDDERGCERRSSPPVDADEGECQ